MTAARNRRYPYPDLPGREYSVLIPYGGRTPRAVQKRVNNAAHGSPRYYRDHWNPRSRVTSLGLRFWWEEYAPEKIAAD